ncbi:MAG: transcriptional repressor [Phycisphaerales bacterium]|nr:MAG: transcriptional repressor [Phycisphaerales bacterium]
MTGAVTLECVREIFARHHLRCTKQREAIYNALRASEGHPTAEALFRQVKPSMDSLSLATVYNTLEVLCRAGLVQKMPTTNGCCRYDADVREHLHVRMTGTDEIQDVPDELGQRLLQHQPAEVLQSIERALGVKIEGVNIQLIARPRTSDSKPQNGTH